MKQEKTNNNDDETPEAQMVNPTISVDIDPLSQLLDLEPGLASSENTSKRNSSKKSDRK